jgi:hypothetical protein
MIRARFHFTPGGRIRGVGFVLIEEWVDEVNPHKFYTMPVSAGTFATKEEAEKEKKQHQPQHVGGYIRVREELRDKPAPKQKKKGRKKPRLRESRRRSGR